MIFICLRLAKRKFQSIKVNFTYTFVGIIFIQMWSIDFHLMVTCTNVASLNTFEASFIDLWNFLHLSDQHRVPV